MRILYGVMAGGAVTAAAELGVADQLVDNGRGLPWRCRLPRR
jgi:gas vesicle protein